ncbi:hypothetical protein WAK64_16310 [Bacillus spongiae]|uniref:DUF3221 domain-containing protein n=1 Tax=Bacillus spongiae TaxID=2683610 RepID=A0ABU8HH50_9BACI
MKKTALICLICTIILQGCGNQTKPMLLATIQSTNDHLIIENGDHFVWENAIITVDEEYTYHMNYLPRGKTSIAYRLFTNEAGTTFQPGLLKVRKVEIMVPQPNDEKDLYYSW